MASRQWYIRDVDSVTKKKLKIFAIKYGLSLAEALAKVVELAEGKSE